MIAEISLVIFWETDHQQEHATRDVIVFGQNLPKNANVITLHDVLEPLKQALLASRDVIISSQFCFSKLQRVFKLGDGCWLPMGILPVVVYIGAAPQHISTNRVKRNDAQILLRPIPIGTLV